CRLKFVEPQRRKVKVATDRARYRLRFIVIGKAGEIAPARVAAQFDQTCAEHDPKSQPAKQPENQDWRPALRKRPSVEQWTKKDRQEAGLKQLNLPAVAVPDLSDVHDRHVHRPKYRE